MTKSNNLQKNYKMKKLRLLISNDKLVKTRRNQVNAPIKNKSKNRKFNYDQE